MAFYTSRVDDEGNEIESRLTSRSMAPSISNGSASSHISLSSRSYDTKSGSVRMSTRRYVNTAVYAESASEGNDMTNHCEGANLYSIKSETQSDIVPPLDLQSEENYPTTRDYTYSYRKDCEPAKLELKPDLAYETWLSAKRKVLSDEAERRKRIEETKRAELEERKRLSQEQYDKWLENKLRQQKQQSSQSSLNQNTTNVSVSQLSRSQLSEEEARERLDEWERTKRMQLERRRRLKREEEQRQRELEETRRRAAADAWANWSAGASKKPTPVPLNRGIFTLRGTISDIFVNPNEWQSILPRDGEGDN